MMGTIAVKVLRDLKDHRQQGLIKKETYFDRSLTDPGNLRNKCISKVSKGTLEFQCNFS